MESTNQEEMDSYITKKRKDIDHDITDSFENDDNNNNKRLCRETEGVYTKFQNNIILQNKLNNQNHQLYIDILSKLNKSIEEIKKSEEFTTLIKMIENDTDPSTISTEENRRKISNNEKCHSCGITYYIYLLGLIDKHQAFNIGPHQLYNCIRFHFFVCRNCKRKTCSSCSNNYIKSFPVMNEKKFFYCCINCDTTLRRIETRNESSYSDSDSDSNDEDIKENGNKTEEEMVENESSSESESDYESSLEISLESEPEPEEEEEEGGGIRGDEYEENAIKLVNGKDNKSLKFREPNDIQRFNPIERKKVIQPMGPLTVLPRRENQNEYTLSPSIKRKGEFASTDDMELNIVKTTEEYNHDFISQMINESTTKSINNNLNKLDIFPMEDLLTKGFMPFNPYPIRDALCVASNELLREVNMIKTKRSLIEAANNQALLNNTNKNNTFSRNKKKRLKNNNGSAVSVNNISSNIDESNNDDSNTQKQVQFNWDIPCYGFNNNTGKTALHETIREFYKDYEERQKIFFLDDELELESEYYGSGSGTKKKNKQLHRPPRSFACFRLIEKQFKIRYDERLNILKDSASRTPKLDDEPPISKSWIEGYRLRPTSTDELCSKGGSCKFNILCKKDNMRYIGRVFETPREIKEKEEYGVNNPNRYIRNKERLCYDCIIWDLTIKSYENVASESVPLIQMNYFTVLCEPGQFNKECMLPVVMNSKPTGITGHVPAYNSGKRISIPLKIQRIEGSTFINITTNFLSETGMDFYQASIKQIHPLDLLNQDL